VHGRVGSGRAADPLAELTANQYDHVDRLCEITANTKPAYLRSRRRGRVSHLKRGYGVRRSRLKATTPPVLGRISGLHLQDRHLSHRRDSVPVS
jgi:hypothetical protein